MPSSQTPITLYTAKTPNGQKVAIYLEELKLAYPDLGLEYESKPIDMSKTEQKEPWFLKINPNGRIPAIVHHRPDGTDFRVFETAAIILYLSQLFDKENKINFDPASDEYSEALQWTFFTHGGVGPMQGQANHFFRYAPEKIPYAIDRYVNETKRLYGVLEDRLAEDGGREYLVGPGKGKFSTADINAWPWVKGWNWSGIDNLDSFAHLSAWIDRIRARPGVHAGLLVPDGVDPTKAKTTEEEEEAARKAREWIVKGQQDDAKKHGKKQN